MASDWFWIKFQIYKNGQEYMTISTSFEPKFLEFMKRVMEIIFPPVTVKKAHHEKKVCPDELNPYMNAVGTEKMIHGCMRKVIEDKHGIRTWEMI